MNLERVALGALKTHSTTTKQKIIVRTPGSATTVVILLRILHPNVSNLSGFPFLRLQSGHHLVIHQQALLQVDASVVISVYGLAEVDGIAEFLLQHWLAGVARHLQQEEASVRLWEIVVRWMVLVQNLNSRKIVCASSIRCPNDRCTLFHCLATNIFMALTWRTKSLPLKSAAVLGSLVLPQTNLRKRALSVWLKLSITSQNHRLRGAVASIPL